jgi:phospholipase D1/2
VVSFGVEGHIGADNARARTETLLNGMESRSGVDFNEAQVALARQWVGDSWDPDALKEVTITTAPTTTEGVVVSEKTKEISTKTYKLPASVDDAIDVIRRFECSAEEGRRNDDVSDTVGQHALQDRSALRDEKWLGTEQEELDWCILTLPAFMSRMLSVARSYVSELSYIHTKLMIVDDRRVIVGPVSLLSPILAELPVQMGSANFNDRSQRVRATLYCSGHDRITR